MRKNFSGLVPQSVNQQSQGEPDLIRAEPMARSRVIFSDHIQAVVAADYIRELLEETKKSFYERKRGSI